MTSSRHYFRMDLQTIVYQTFGKILHLEIAWDSDLLSFCAMGFDSNCSCTGADTCSANVTGAGVEVSVVL